MLIILSQCFRVRCEPKSISTKNETSVKHHRGSLEEIRLYSENHDKKKLKIYANITKNNSSFLQESLQYAGRSVVLKV